jgi:hypothetical protein
MQEDPKICGTMSSNQLCACTLVIDTRTLNLSGEKRAPSYLLHHRNTSMTPVVPIGGGM